MTAQSQAYIKLAELASRSRQHAQGLPEQDDFSGMQSGIGFLLGGRRYVSPIPEIAEIIPTPKFTQVPGVQSWVRGVANVRGRLLPIMDLGVFVYDKMSHQQARRKRVVIVDRGELYSGVVVDEVFGMQHFESTDYRSSISSDVDPAVEPYLNGEYVKDGESWPVFSPFKLAVDPKFLKAAS
jgi:twitching motility protein PilI